MKLYLASNNRHKVSEMNALAIATGGAVEILSAREAGGMPAVVEDTGTFIGNARKKARALKEKLPPGSPEKRKHALPRFSFPKKNLPLS